MKTLKQKAVVLEEQITPITLHQQIARWEALSNQQFHITGDLGKLQIDFRGTGRECAQYIRKLTQQD